ncbi:hypothetical protein C8R48DRAFT_130427 [Suillus tomentosus]|nr:hypothetical protein C8R48DRAFT_130427 [Suillus tomentosus]
MMLPIVNVLEHVLKLKRRSRIWLCPTATFTSIPLHAAHPFQTKADRSGKGPCLEDLCICSYTPTLSVLIRPRESMKKSTHPSFVAIGQGQPGAGKGKALLAVESKLELVHKLVPVTVNRTSRCTRRCYSVFRVQERRWHAVGGRRCCRKTRRRNFLQGDLKKGGVMDCTKAAWAPSCHAMHGVKTKVPLEQRIVFVHIGM